METGERVLLFSLGFCLREVMSKQGVADGAPGGDETKEGQNRESRCP